MISTRILRISYCSIKSFVSRRCRSSHSFHFKEINCYGSLIVKCPSVLAHIKSINPHDIPNGDEAFIQVDSLTNDIDLSDAFDVAYSKDSSIITVNANNDILEAISKDVNLHIQVPHIYNIDIEALSINIDETEGDVIKLISYGDCVLGKIKTVNTDILSHGSLTCKNFFGNGNINVHGNLCIRKLQSSNVVIGGQDIDISAVYCPHFKCNSADGKIFLQSLHGKANIGTQSGSVVIGSSAGDIEIQTDSGNVEVTIERCENAHIITESGNIDVGLGSSISAFIEAKGQYIDIPEDLLIDGMKEQNSSGYQCFEGRFGDGLSSIKTHTTSGSISFARKSWYSQFQFDS